MPMDWEKWQQKRQTQVQPPDLDKVVENIKRFRGRMPSYYVIIGLILAAWILSGIFIVAPDEIGVVKRFGAYTRTAGSGPHYHLPYPIETVLKPKVTQVRRFEVGFRTVNPGPPPQYRPVPNEALMLTGDENIIDVQFIVQYKISDPITFLFKVADPIKTIQDSAEAAMREVIGKNNIDEALTTGKNQIQQDAEKTLQDILNRYESGLQVIAVQLQAVHPPQQVIEAFKDVASAREDQNRFINEAEGYANDILPKAKGQAAQIMRQSEAYREEKINRAKGDASRFLSQLKEYQKARDVTRRRLYLETMEEILAGAEKFIVDKGQADVVPYLPLNELRRWPSGPEKKGGN
ncbi:MAG: FtsH protease activity modulator HflK [Thermodesulfobacteriota bacterium]